MKSLIFAFLGVIAISSVSFGSVSDCDFVPEWAGAPTSTHQVWNFDTPVLVSPADVDENPFGTPIAVVDIVSPILYPNGHGLGEWLAEDGGRQGVFKLYGPDAIILEIQNDPTPRPIKEMIVLVTYSTEEMLDISVKTGIDATIESLPGDDYIELDNSYICEKFEFKIEPNPPAERIEITPRFCRLYVDKIEVWTNCVPEPATMGLLGFGSLILFRRRKQ